MKGEPCMDFLSLAKQRCSIRSYKEQKVEQEKIDAILEAARVAPSACNKQPIRIAVLQTEEQLSSLQSVYSTFHAPLAFLVCAKTEEAWVRKYDQKNASDIDASIVCDHMMMEATALGLGSVWVCAFDPELMKQTFQLPKGVEPINLLLVGYGEEGTKKTEDRHTSERKTIQELLL